MARQTGRPVRPKEVDQGALWHRHAISAGIIIGMIWAACVYRPDLALRVAVGLTAHDLCSATFVSRLDPDLYFAEGIAPRPGYRLIARYMHYEVHRDAGEVIAQLGQIRRKATFSPGRGCLLQLDGARPLPSLAPQPAHLALTPPWPAEVTAPSDPAIARGLDTLFAEADPKNPRRVKAVVVLKDGKIVAERYGAGYSVATPINGWSVSKSVVNALLGILARQGKLNMSDPAPVALWRLPGDPRAAITYDQLERMESGLSVDEDNSGFDVSSQILFTARDTARAAMQRPLKRPPGTEFHYGSPNTLILARLIENAVGGTPEAFFRFAHTELFDPLGMDHVTVETDAEGTPLAASYILAPARSWARFGELYADDGVVQGVRLLPPGWVDQSRRSTLGSNYGAGFWTNGSEAPEARGRVAAGFPRDGFFASGAMGQRLYILPKEHLVFARFGLSPNGDNGIVEDLAFLRLLRARLHLGR